MLLWNSYLDGRIESYTGSAIRIESDTIGNFIIGNSAVIEGEIGIEVHDDDISFDGAIIHQGWLESTAADRVAVDFADASSSLDLEVSNGGVVMVNILGSTGQASDSLIMNNGSVLGDIDSVENIAVRGRDDYSALLGHIYSGENITIEGNLIIGNSELDSDFLNDEFDVDTYKWDADYSQSGHVLFAVDEIHEVPDVGDPEPVVEIDGNAVITGSATFGIYGRGFYQPEAATYRLMEVINGNLTLDSETDSVSFFHTRSINVTDNAGTWLLDMTLTPRDADTVGDGLPSSQEGVVEALTEAATRLVNDASARAVDNLYKKLEEITVDDVVSASQKLASQFSANNAEGGRAASDAAADKAGQSILSRIGQFIGFLLGSSDFSTGSQQGMNAGDTPLDSGFWLQGLNTKADQKSYQNSEGTRLNGFDVQVDGLTMGIDRLKGSYVFGMAATLGHSTTQIKGEKDTDAADFYQLSLYGSWIKEDWFVNSIMSAGWSDLERTRYVDGVSDAPLKSDPQQQNVRFNVLAGKSIPVMENLTVQPLAGMTYAYQKTEAYTEKDPEQSGFAKKTNRQSYSKFELGLGAKVTTQFDMEKGAVIPSAQIMGWYDVRG
ncbi:hypothetical protein CI610_02289 [invertebrate metagenome]|uniref:Autotransporter domain-containing protein n=1 Tax=invertebrate metagenome TaxID=1711999 RepID=A0A2H9T6B5_9ZZZZ